MTKTFIMKEIRKIKDVQPLANLVFKHFQYLSNFPNLSHTLSEINRLLTDENFIGLLVYNDKSLLVAYLIGELKHLNDGRLIYYISYFYVCKKYQKKNIGSQLLACLVNKCRKWGIKFIVMTCDTNDQNLINFYTKRGFMVDSILKNNTRHEIFSMSIY